MAKFLPEAQRRLSRWLARAFATSVTLIWSVSSYASANTGETDSVKEAARIYSETCVVCHGEGIAGAPRPGVKSDWTVRLEFGIEEMYLNTIEGIGSRMPPRGRCMGCSDRQLQAVVDLMIRKLE